MKNMMWLAAAVLVAMTSCSKNEATEPEVQGNAIGFKTFVDKSSVNPFSKGAPVSGNEYPKGSSFGVFAYFTTGAWTAEATPNFMYNQQVTKTELSYDYSPVKYWPSGQTDKVSFFAYSPFATAENGIELVGTNATAGAPSIKYTVPADVSKQIDLMYAKANDQTSAVASVGLTFKHALTQVKFSAKLDAALPAGSAVKITSLAVSGLDMKGTVSLADGTVSLSGTADGSFTWSDLPAASFATGEGATAKTLSGDDALMLLPQAVTGKTVSITYEVTVTDANLAAPVTTTYTKDDVELPDATWTANQRINYVLTVGVSGNAVKVSANVAPWAENETPIP